MKYLLDVFEFHQKFGIEQPDSPRQLPDELLRFRLKFLIEELEEYEIALRTGNLENQLDALVDLVYVALGNALISGFDFHEAWRRVQLANMAKERAASDGSNSARGSSFDVVKPEGWRAPSHTDLVQPSYVRAFPRSDFNYHVSHEVGISHPDPLSLDRSTGDPDLDSSCGG